VKSSQLIQSLIIVIPLGCLFIQPIVANNAKQKANNSQLEILAKPSTRAADLLAQETTSRVVKIVGVKLNPTNIALRGCHRTYSGRNESRIRTTDVIPL
jgi:hypothetical protein